MASSIPPEASDLVIPFALFVALTVVVVARAALTLARRAGMPRPAAWSGRIALALAIWLGVVAGVASTGFYAETAALPPRVPLTALVASATLVLTVLRSPLRTLFDATPLAWLLALQAFRLPVELFLWGLHRRGLVPEQMTFEGRNFDIVVGLTAPLVAWAAHRRHVGRGALLVWNLVSFAALANIVFIAITSMPGPLARSWGGVAPLVVTRAPFVWLPAWLVPLAASLHILTFRRLLARPLASEETPANLG